MPFILEGTEKESVNVFKQVQDYDDDDDCDDGYDGDGDDGDIQLLCI